MCNQCERMGLGVVPSQSSSLHDPTYPENMTSDTCLALLLFTLALIFRYKIPSVMASIQ